ncbi:MAG: hypothetical protein U9Q83_07285 [Bacteroidota bacterium]|nr:hypothetical protein [Bacteroidota bacterium]
MRKVYIDRKLKTYVVPSEMRNNSKAENKVFTPGTRIPLPQEAKTVRLFTAWARKETKWELFVKFCREKDVEVNL